MSNAPHHWTRTYFGTLYGEIYRQHLMPVAAARTEAEFAANLLQLRGKRVLDLASGYGRHARHLARTNTVYALDFNREYLAQSLQSLRGPAQRNLHLVQSDMRHLPLAAASLDAVLLLFNSFGYFIEPPATEPTAAPPKQQVWKLPQVFYERQLVPQTFGQFAGAAASEAKAPTQSEPRDQNASVLQEIARVLRPGGQLLIELPNLKPLLAAVGKQPRRHMITRAFELEEQYVWDDETRILHNRTRFKTRDAEESSEYHLRLYTLAEMKQMLKQHGLSPARTYGSYEAEKYTAASSPVMLIQAKNSTRHTKQ